MDIKNKEALIAEIEQFKEEALKMHIVQVLADTYERSSLFDHNINADGSVIWFKTQARQLWDFWQAAKAQAVPKYHMENIRDALVIACDIKEDEGRFEDSLNYIHQAMIEAQEKNQ